jgi:hypothetical protein
MYSYCSTTLTKVFPCFNTVIYVFLLLGLCVLIVRLPWLRFFRAFSSSVRQMPGYNSPSRARPALFQIFVPFSNFVLYYVSFVLCRSVYCLCVNVYLQLPPCGNPLAVNKYIISYIILLCKYINSTFNAFGTKKFTKIYVYWIINLSRRFAFCRQHVLSPSWMTDLESILYLRCLQREMSIGCNLGWWRSTTTYCMTYVHKFVYWFYQTNVTTHRNLCIRSNIGYVNVKLQIPLCRLIVDPGGSWRLKLPDFQTVGIWRWSGCKPYAQAACTT